MSLANICKTYPNGWFQRLRRGNFRPREKGCMAVILAIPKGVDAICGLRAWLDHSRRRSLGNRVAKTRRAIWRVYRCLEPDETGVGALGGGQLHRSRQPCDS